MCTHTHTHQAPHAFVNTFHFKPNTAKRAHPFTPRTHDTRTCVWKDAAAKIARWAYAASPM